MHTVTNAIKKFGRMLILGDFKQLLLMLLLLFLFRPYGGGHLYVAIWHVFFTGVLFAAIFNCHHTPKVKIAALALGIPTMIVSWWSLFDQTEWSFIAAWVAALLFLVFSIFSLLKRVLLEKIDPDVLRGTICVYFMIGFAFGIVYILIEFFQPGSFKTAVETPNVSFPHGIFHPEVVYFSFITILAVGFGDITPAIPLAQGIVVIEGIIGQFYLAIIVARIVTSYSYRESSSSKKEKK